jgi:hypothetical protein
MWEHPNLWGYTCLFIIKFLEVDAPNIQATSKFTTPGVDFIKLLYL